MKHTHNAIALLEEVEKRILGRGLEAEPPRQENLEYRHMAKANVDGRLLTLTWTLYLRSQIRVEVAASMERADGSDESVTLCYYPYQGYKGQEETWTTHYEGSHGGVQGYLCRFAERNHYFPVKKPIDRERWFRYLDDLLSYCFPRALRPPLAS